MGSIYARRDRLWMAFYNADGKRECKSTGYRKGQEEAARELLAEVERQVGGARNELVAPERSGASDEEAIAHASPAAVVEAVAVPVGPAAAPEALTVRAYGNTWVERRRGQIATAESEETSLRLHIYPLIGEMALAEVRPRHIRDLVMALKAKTSTAPKCKNARLAPRTVRHVFALLRRLFKSAVIDEHIASSPVVVEKGVLPKNVDKDRRGDRPRSSIDASSCRSSPTSTSRRFVASCMRSRGSRRCGMVRRLA
jgi:hypothetical protein